MSNDVIDLRNILPAEQDDLTYYEAPLEVGAIPHGTDSIVSWKRQARHDVLNGPVNKQRFSNGSVMPFPVGMELEKIDDRWFLVCRTLHRQIS